MEQENGQDLVGVSRKTVWFPLVMLAAAFTGACLVNTSRVLDHSWMLFDATSVLSMVVFVFFFWLAGGGWCGAACGVSLLPSFLKHQDAKKDCAGRCLLLAAVGLGIHGAWVFLLRLAMEFYLITQNPQSNISDLIRGLIWSMPPLFLSTIVLMMVLIVRQRIIAGRRRAVLSCLWVLAGFALSFKIDMARELQVDSVVLDFGFLVGVVVFAALCVVPVLGFGGTFRSKLYLLTGTAKADGVRTEAIGFCTVVLTAIGGYGAWICMLRLRYLLTMLQARYPDSPQVNTNDLFGTLCWGISPLVTACVLLSLVWVLRQRLTRP